MDDHERVLILGLDGAPWSLLDPWLADGKLPNLARLIASGVRAPLSSTVPYVTAPAWVSCVTGKNPGKHGVFDFAQQRRDDYGIDVINSTRVQAKQIWTLLSEAGQQVGMVNVPVTYPPQPVNGVMVTCMLTPSLKSRFTYPDALREELLQAVPAYVIEPMTASSDIQRTKAELARNLGPAVEARAEVTRWLMDKLGDWHFFMTVFTEPDRLMTYVWDDFDPRHPRHDAASARQYGDLFLRHFQHLDTIVGQFMDAWLDKATILIVSDHGFGGVHRFFYPNVWLQQNGYLTLNDEARPSPLARARLLARSLGLAHQAKKVAKRLFPDWGFTTGARQRDFVQAVDWGRTRAYWAADNGLTINLKGRQAQGIVEPSEYEPLRDEIIARWADLREPETGELVVERVYKREDLYSGPYVENSPDLRVVWKEYPEQRKVYFSAGELWADDCWGYSGQTGDHAPRGILIAGGRNVAHGVRLEGARLIDIAPTVLYALGEPVPNDMDGVVLHDLFSPGFRGDDHSAASSSDSPAAVTVDERTSNQASPYSAAEEAAVEERLKALGYLD